MKRLTLLFSLFFFLLPATPPVYSHGGPPFVLINGESDGPNPIFSGSIFFKVPTEVAPKNYLVNEKINFKIDLNTAPIDPNQISQTVFTWDTGDGKSYSGTEINHTYSKAGSYVVVLKVKDAVTIEPIEIESLGINVLPSENYQLPQVKIKINGKEIKDPLKEPALVTSGDKVSFETSGSNGKIKTYKWDFGDGSDLATGSKVEHSFDFTSPFGYSFFPILRIEDENGFYTDTIVQITDKNSLENPSTANNQSGKDVNWPLMILIGSAAALTVAGTLFFLTKKSREDH